MTRNDKISLSSVKWAVGVSVTIFIAMSGFLWSVTARAQDRSSRIIVLEVRADKQDEILEDVKTSFKEIADTLDEIKKSQTRTETNVENIKDKILD